MDINELMPRPAHRITHDRLIAAPAPALRETRLRQLPLSYSLTVARHLAAVLLRRERMPAPGEGFIDAAPIPLIADSCPGPILSAGVGQPWRWFGGEAGPVVSAVDFAQWNEPGWVKVVEVFTVEAIEAGGGGSDGSRWPRLGSRVNGEIRIAATDARTAARFARYWGVIRPASLAMRRELTRVAGRRAVAAEGAGT